MLLAKPSAWGEDTENASQFLERIAIFAVTFDAFFLVYFHDLI